ncbi:unnamed protein product [Linum trigynum]|uniref:Uncharacterized protein n=1 Tax=Linum trigynum TaxID=586398 RepID=A0AAV2E124_9ROSI
MFLPTLMAHYDMRTNNFIFGEGENKKVLTIYCMLIGLFVVCLTFWLIALCSSDLQQVLTIKDEDVACVYGIPLGGAEIDLVKANKSMLKVLKEELSMEGNRERNVKVVELTESTKCRGRERRRPPVAVAVR